MTTAARRDFYLKALDRAHDQANSDEIRQKTAGDLKDMLQLLDKNWQKFEDEHLNLIPTIEDEAEQLSQQSRFEMAETRYLHSRKAYRERIEELTPAPTVSNTQQAGNQQVPVIVKPPDSLANIVNTWNTFDGKHKDWPSFRDRFLGGTKELDPVNQLHLLQAAVKGEAASRMGKLPLTKENFQVSMDRLKKAFEDTYLVVQDLIRTMSNIPRMHQASRKGIRNIIDTTEECLHQLKNYVRIENWDTWIVFTTIDRLDSTTKREWEIYRKGLAKQNKPNTLLVMMESTRNNDESMDLSRDLSQSQNDKQAYIPTWEDMQTFLEEQAGVLMHSESDNSRNSSRDSSLNRGESTRSSRGHQKNHQQHNQQSYKQQANNQQANNQQVHHKQAQQQNANQTDNEEDQVPTGYELCKACKVGDHSLFRCPDWNRWNLQKRRDHVLANNLCYRCCRPNHGDTQCGYYPTKPCPRCPQRQFHNSYLCPTREADRNTAYLNQNLSHQSGQNSQQA